MSAPPLPQVLCAGRLYCDLVFNGTPNLPTPGTETFSAGLSLHAGGGAAITGATFSALNWPVSLLATLPAPPFEATVRDQLRAAGLDLSLCTPAGPTLAPQITVAIPSGSDRAFLTHKSGAAIPAVTLPAGPWRHLHIGELRTLQEHPDLLGLARTAGMTISLDCGWDAQLLDQGAELAPLIDQVDVFLPNSDEAHRLAEAGLPDRTAPLTVVKCGAQGARATGADGWIHARTTPVPVIDATGAGDAFNGGFLAGWLTGAPLAECLRLGNRCGGAAVQADGGLAGVSALASVKDPLTAAQ